MSAWFKGRWRTFFEPWIKDSRLRRGFGYYKDGAVSDVVVDKGEIRSEVRGSRSRPYLVTFKIEPLSHEQWMEIGRTLAQDPELLRQVEKGRGIKALEEKLASPRLSLFPDWYSELTDLVCTCPDEECPCKHAAATFYAVMDIFDKEPSLFFRLRGKDQYELLALVSALAQDEASVTQEAESHEEGPVGVYEEYWGKGEGSHPSQVPLGDAQGNMVLPGMPFPDRQDLIRRTLQEAYRLASRLARRYADQMDSIG